MTRDAPTIGRFRLEDHINGDATSGLWRAHDQLLKRTVSVRLIPSSDPQQEQMRTAALAAARVVDRRVAAVIDVLDLEGTLVIVSEWVDGIPLEQLLATPIPAGRAIHITSEVALAVEAIHNAGVTHGRIRPASVMITDEGEVRLRGHCLDAKRFGISPGFEPVNADISCIGALMMACLTGYWPGMTPAALPQAPVLGGKRTVPSQLRADITKDLDTFVIRAMAAVPSSETVESSNPFTTATSAVTALTGLSTGESLIPFREITGGPEDIHGDRPAPPPSRATTFKRAVAMSLAIFVAAAGLLIGSRLLMNTDPTISSTSSSVPSADGRPPAGTAAPESPGEAGATGSLGGAADGLAVGTPRLLPPAATGVIVESDLPIVSVSTIQPYGAGITTRDAPGRAVDGDRTTAWLTPFYDQVPETTSGAAGIVLDLGTKRQIRTVNLGLVGNNTNLELLYANKLSPNIADYKRMRSVVGAPAIVSLREPAPIPARYVAIMLTSVPVQADGFRGGINFVQLSGQ